MENPVGRFRGFPATLDDILSNNKTSTIECKASGVEIEIEFSTRVISATTITEGTGGTGVSVSDRSVTFTADTLEDSATEFVTWLDTCGEEDDVGVIASFSYKDNEGNDPNTTAAKTPRLSEYDRTFQDVSCSLSCVEIIDTKLGPYKRFKWSPQNYPRV